MIYRIQCKGRSKYACRVKDREELLALRNAPENLAHLEKARQGDPSEKMKLVQFAYNLGYAEGPLKGCKSVGSQFFHDVDCYDAAESEATKALILAKKEEIGLMMLERSAVWRWTRAQRTCSGWCSRPAGARRTCPIWTTPSSTSLCRQRSAKPNTSGCSSANVAARRPSRQGRSGRTSITALGRRRRVTDRQRALQRYSVTARKRNAPTMHRLRQRPSRRSIRGLPIRR